MPVLGPSDLATRSIGEIAAALPGATAVFRAHKLDFCCGGAVPLGEAARARGLPLDGIAQALAALDPAAAPTAPAETGALIDHIVARYHETHRREIPELVRLARRLEARHGARDDAPHGIAAALEDLGAELELHMCKEEQILFPLMRMGGSPMIAHPIARMRFEHDGHGERIAAIEKITRGGELPADACGTWRALYAGVRKLIDDLQEHVHTENNVLFPRFADPAAPPPAVCMGPGAG